MVEKSWRRLAMLAMVLGAAACGDDPVGPGSTATENLTVVLTSPGEVTLESLGDAFTIEARVVDAEGRDVGGRSLVYRADVPGVLEPTGAAGEFRSVGAGHSRVWVEVVGATGSGSSALVQVTVEPKPVALSIGAAAPVEASEGVITLWAIGQETILPVWTADANGHPIAPVRAGLEWSVDDDGVTLVDHEGRLEAVTDGVTEVRVSAGGMSGTARVEVRASLELSSCVETSSAGQAACGSKGLTFLHGRAPSER